MPSHLQALLALYFNNCLSASARATALELFIRPRLVFIVRSVSRHVFLMFAHAPSLFVCVGCFSSEDIIIKKEKLR